MSNNTVNETLKDRNKILINAELFEYLNLNILCGDQLHVYEIKIILYELILKLGARK